MQPILFEHIFEYKKFPDSSGTGRCETIWS